MDCILNKKLTEIAALYIVFLWMRTEISGVWLCEGIWLARLRFILKSG